MNLQFNNSNELSFEEGTDLSLIVLCEDLASAIKACKILKLLNRQLRHEAGRLLYQWWNFEFLLVEELWKVFAAETSVADMIIVGVPERLVFPERFALWLQQLPDLRKKRPGAMIAVLNPAANGTTAESELIMQLKQASALSHMDFFRDHAPAGFTAGHPAHWDHQKDSERFREDIRRRHETPFRIDCSVGGLNEETD